MGRKKKEDHKARQPQQAADPLEARQASAKLTATAGALAGVVARFVVGPLDVLKIRFQVQLEPIAAGAMPAHYTSLRQALVTIVKEEGVKVRGDSGAERPIHQATGLWQRRQQRQWCRQRGPLGKEGAAGQGGSHCWRRACCCLPTQCAPLPCLCRLAGPVARHRARPAADRALHRRPVCDAAALPPAGTAVWAA